MLTLEFPHLLRLIELNEFDTIYHEHFSYFSLLSTIKIMEAHGLRVFDVEELKSHGGSLRVYACRAESQTHIVEPNVQKVLADEEDAELDYARGLRELCAASERNKVRARGFSAHSCQAGQDSRWLWSAGQERDSAALLRHRKGPDRIHRGSQPIQARAISAGHPHPDLSSRPDPRDQAGLCRDSALESERRNHGAVAVHSGVGRTFRCADSEE